MAAVIPIVPKAESLLIHTGNIVNWNRLKRKLTQSPSEELLECVGSTLETWLGESDRDELQDAKNIECYYRKFIEKLPEAERSELKVTAKIFLCNSEPASVSEAVEQVMSELGITHLETVLLSMPESQRTVADIKPVWETLEGIVNREQIFTLGLADLDKPVLEQLYNEVKVSPSTNQVNLASCCVMPPELTEFAKENDIQLLTHNDPSCILPTADFCGQLSEKLTTKDAEGWEPSWIVRYSVIIKCRGIIKTKGYVLKAARNLRARPL